MAEVDDQLAGEIQQNPQFMQIIQQQAQSNPEFLAQLQQNPEMLRQLYQDYTGQEGIANEQLAQADALRNTQVNEGMNAGGQFVAGSPLSQLAKVGNQGMAAYQQRQAMDKKKALSEDRTSGLTSTVQGMSAPQQGADPRAEALRKLQMMKQNQNAQFSA
jgi:hypothetical protein